MIKEGEAHPHPSCCGHEKQTPQAGKLFKHPLAAVIIAMVFMVAASFVILSLVPFRHTLSQYLKIIGLPVTLGFILGGLIDYYVPREYISKFLSQDRKRTVFYAAGLGFLMSACSHGILAICMEIHKKGASGPAVVSFLLASPWANLPITLLLLGFFGWKGVLIILAAIFIAITTGLGLQLLDRRNWIEKNKYSVAVGADFSIRGDMARRISEYPFGAKQVYNDLRGIAKGIWALADMILWWVLLGIFLASLVGAFVPHGVFQRFLGPSLLGLLITLVAAALLEVCSEGTSPLAFEIYKQTGAFGNAFAFLMGGVVTDYTEIGLIWINVGRKTALWMLAFSLPQVLMVALLFNRFF